MYKRLRVYYLYTALPFVLLLLGAAIYHKAILKTITSNPHPQVNYLIFAITLVGGVLILLNIGKLMHEAKELAKFAVAKKEGTKVEELVEHALNCDADIAYVLRMMAVTTDRSITHQEQIAIETELHKASSRINSRNAIPQFLGGLLVGMGLLGTFIGLLATLDDIAVLISSFGSLDMKTADPIAVFSQMVKRMEAPMHSMGIAFSASMYGLLGSIVLGFMMVSVRRCISEIMSNLGSEVAQHIEFALARDGFVYSRSGIKAGFTKRPTEALTAKDMMGNSTEAAEKAPVTTTTGTSEAKEPAKSTMFASKSKPSIEFEGELSDEIRVLKRIEERIAESARIQERTISVEIEDFSKQRAETLRVLAENLEASTQFRAELQRVGRQLGDIIRMSDKGQMEINDQVRELKLGTVDGSAETHRLLMALIELQRNTLDELRAGRQ
ncbi:MAG TPA: MotA/TolQ/ExbB proton channel family protein [Methylotenera sp.]|nr:MotA/TolQ/ExbB proton channel family protein [Methylotenera sp.]